jgi:squalene synthase HpnC
MPVDHYENFPVASLLLPRRLRRPIEAIYRFARSADDIADEGDASDAQRVQALAAYRAQIDRIERGETPDDPDDPDDPLFAELAATVRAWRLPTQLLRDLIDAFAQDVVKTRYADYAQLLDYCRRSANPVGRLLLHLCDRADGENLRRSDCICTALQLINFWQDVAVDWAKGRIYIPKDDLARFGVEECDFGEPAHPFRWSERWAALLAFECARARALMHEGAPLVHALPGRMGWEIRLTVQGGLAILDAIDRVRGDVYAHRPQLRSRDWLRMGSRALFM